MIPHKDWSGKDAGGLYQGKVGVGGSKYLRGMGGDESRSLNGQDTMQEQG